LHELARDVVNRSNVVGVYGVAQAETVCEQSRSQKKRVMVEGHRGPYPTSAIKEQEDAINGNHAAANVIGSITEDATYTGRGHPGLSSWTRPMLKRQNWPLRIEMICRSFRELRHSDTDVRSILQVLRERREPQNT
jgi:hypothetical protein